MTKTCPGNRIRVNSDEEFLKELARLKSEGRWIYRMDAVKGKNAAWDLYTT